MGVTGARWIAGGGKSEGKDRCRTNLYKNSRKSTESNETNTFPLLRIHVVAVNVLSHRLRSLQKLIKASQVSVSILAPGSIVLPIAQAQILVRSSTSFALAVQRSPCRCPCPHSSQSCLSKAEVVSLLSKSAPSLAHSESPAACSVGSLCSRPGAYTLFL